MKEYTELDGIKAGMAITDTMTDEDKKRADEEWQRLVDEVLLPLIA